MELLSSRPQRYGSPVHDLSLWLEFAGVEMFAQSMFSRCMATPVTFLWRPCSRPQFWSAVESSGIRTIPDTWPAVAGLSVRPGRLFQPDGVIYDYQALRETVRLSFWDSYEQRHCGIRAQKKIEKFLEDEMQRQVWSRSGAKDLNFKVAVFGTSL